jgi:hypothetical protein
MCAGHGSPRGSYQAKKGTPLPTLKERHVIAERLQAVEDDLLAAGKRHAIIKGVAGHFEWYTLGAQREPLETAQPGDIQEVEDMIVTHARDKVTAFSTKAGRFIWFPN